MAGSKKALELRATELGQVVREIVKRFEGANAAAANGPHADLTMQETRVVELLAESGAQMMRAVAEYLGVAVNSVTSIADNLERKGFLRRVRSDSDRRVVQVELTPEGVVAGRSVRDIKDRFHREMLAALTEEEQAILLVLLRKIGGLGHNFDRREHETPMQASNPDAMARKSPSISRTRVDGSKPKSTRGTQLRDDSSGPATDSIDAERTDAAHSRTGKRKTK